MGLMGQKGQWAQTSRAGGHAGADDVALHLQDTLAAQVVLEQIAPSQTRLKHLWVDNGYRGAFIALVKRQFGITVEVV
jgi:hypothetical protein